MRLPKKVADMAQLNPAPLSFSANFFMDWVARHEVDLFLERISFNPMCPPFYLGFFFGGGGGLGSVIIGVFWTW